MRCIKYIAVVLLLAACNNKPGGGSTSNADSASNKTATKDTSGEYYVHKFSNKVLEAKIEDTLMKIPFVKKTNSYIDSFSHHKSGMSFILDSAEKGISVIAGYNGTERFETYYNFVVDPVTFDIKVMDDLSGEMITVKEYIRRLSNNEE